MIMAKPMPAKPNIAPVEAKQPFFLTVTVISALTSGLLAA